MQTFYWVNVHAAKLSTEVLSGCATADMSVSIKGIFTRSGMSMPHEIFINPFGVWLTGLQSVCGMAAEQVNDCFDKQENVMSLARDSGEY